MTASHDNLPPLARKLLWFVALWLLGTGAVAAVAYLLRLWIAPH